MDKNISKKWLVTKHSFNIDEHLKQIEELNISIKCIIYQGEHLFVSFKDCVSYSDMKKIFPGAHFEKVNQDTKTVSNYIFK